MTTETLDIDKLLDDPLEAKSKENAKALPPPVREVVKKQEVVIEKPKEEDRKRKRSSRSKSRSKSRERKKRRSRERSRERDREREREKERNRDKRTHRERSRSRERDSDRRRSRSRERRRSDRDRRSPDRSSGRSRDKERDKEKDRKKEPSPNPDDATRGARTVFAYNLPTKATSTDIWKFFEQAGKVRDVRLIQDRNSRKSKGFGYIEMDSINAVTNAIQLSGTQMMGKTVMVQASQAERNELQTQQKQQQPTRLYVGGLHANVTDQDVESMFTEFGDVDFVDLHREPETGLSKGFAFVQFRDPEAAKRALVQVNGREMLGRTLKVGLVNAATGKAVGVLGELDEEGGGGLSLDAQARVVLMSKLQRSDEKLPLGSSSCLLLKNMFSSEDTTEPNFEQELTEDIKEECSKHGDIRHMNIDVPNGVVYLRFNSASQASKALSDLHGRWFGGRMVEVTFIPEGTYLTKFPHAR